MNSKESSSYHIPCGSMTSNNGKKKDVSAETAPLLPEGQDTNVTPEQAAAWMAQYGANNPYFYGGPPAHGSPGGAPPPPVPYMYQGYPLPHGYSPVGPPQGQGFYPPPPFMYPPPFATAPQAAQRPPRSQKLSPGTPVSTPVLPEDNSQTLPEDSSPKQQTLSSIPSMSDIFSDTQPLLPSSNNSPGSNPAGYGTTAPPQQPKVYNAPPRSSNKSSVSDKSGRSLPRANSGSDCKNLSTGSSRPSPSHRRISSDGPLRQAHRRLGSNDELPPIGHHRRSSSRGRSYSSGNVKKPTHRRADSASSMLSNLSRNSVVSNISKSEFFAGVDEKGRVQMHYPFEAIRLVMVDPEQPTLRRGHLYFDGHVGDSDKFEEYHRLTEEDGMLAPQWESLDHPVNRCGCTCNNCNGCQGKKDLLPSPCYMLAVDDTVYKSVMAEIANAHSMPCGLFFCGHHEDVAYPSVLIALFVVVVLMAYMMIVAYSFDDL